MEFWLFLGGSFVVIVYLIWRSRVGTSSDVDSLTKGLPDDLRDKNTGSIAATHGGWSGGNDGSGGGSGGG